MSVFSYGPKWSVKYSLLDTQTKTGIWGSVEEFDPRIDSLTGHDGHNCRVTNSVSGSTNKYGSYPRPLASSRIGWFLFQRLLGVTLVVNSFRVLGTRLSLLTHKSPTHSSLVMVTPTISSPEIASQAVNQIRFTDGYLRGCE
jgi:hypothetical protein